MKNILPLFLSVFLFLSGCDSEENAPVMICGVAMDNCDLVPNSGPCYAYIPKYYFDKTEGKCKEFIWGGCGGVVPFNTMEECRQCEKSGSME